jgi:hypothetical protein
MHARIEQPAAAAPYHPAAHAAGRGPATAGGASLAGLAACLRQSSPPTMTLHLLPLRLLAGMVVLRGGAAACQRHGDCPSNQYCAPTNICASCSVIVPGYCATYDGAFCCNTTFIQQCPTNPHGCVPLDVPTGATVAVGQSLLDFAVEVGVPLLRDTVLELDPFDYADSYDWGISSAYASALGIKVTRLELGAVVASLTPSGGAVRLLLLFIIIIGSPCFLKKPPCSHAPPFPSSLFRRRATLTSFVFGCGGIGDAPGARNLWGGHLRAAAGADGGAAGHLAAARHHLHGGVAHEHSPLWRLPRPQHTPASGAYGGARGTMGGARRLSLVNQTTTRLWPCSWVWVNNGIIRNPSRAMG